MILLDSINVLNEGMFSTKDVIYLLVLILGGAAGYWKLISSNKENQVKIKTVEKENVKEFHRFDGEVIAIKNRERGIKSELTELIKEKEAMLHNRVDKTQQEMKSYVDKTETEFKSINDNVAKIQSDTSEMKGMLSTLLNQSK